jgi:hypothetical protein
MNTLEKSRIAVGSDVPRWLLKMSAKQAWAILTAGVLSYEIPCRDQSSRYLVLIAAKLAGRHVNGFDRRLLRCGRSVPASYRIVEYSTGDGGHQ